MAWLDIEKSEESAKPLELYYIKLGLNEYYLTDFYQNYTFEGKTYIPVQIARNEIIIDDTTFDDKIKIKVPLRSTIGKALRNETNEQETNVVIRRAFQGETETLILWRGVVYSREIESGYLTIVCLPINYKLEKVGNRSVYSRLCSHLIYDQTTCKVNKNSFVTNATLTAISQKTAVVSATLDSKFVGGYIEFANGQARMITDVNGSTITLLSELYNIPTDRTVKIYLGCDRTQDCCKTRFNNIENYGGFPYIPIKNIFTSSIN